MNYHHYFHAGNAADVFKHVILLVLLEYVKQKDKPFCVIDTHAGYGEYDLTQLHIQEWRQGLSLIHQQRVQHPLLKLYSQLTLDTSHFPGSPLIVRDALREQDELILIEKEPEAYQALRMLFQRDKQVHTHQLDAYHFAKALLPPRIKRGLIFIDPPYEDPLEFNKLPQLLFEAYRRFPTAIYALWYPIKNRALIKRFHQHLKQTLTVEMFILEMCLWPDDVPMRLNGSGLVILNAPWKFNDTLQPMMTELLSLLRQHEKAFWHGQTL